MTCCQWLYLVEPGQEGRWGREAIALSEVARTGVPVLPGFVVSRDAVQSFFLQPDLKKGITKSLKGVTSAKPALISGVAKEIRSLIIAAELPVDLEKDFRDFVVTLEEQVLIAKGKGLNLTVSLMSGELQLASLTELAKDTTQAAKLFKKLLALAFSDHLLFARLETKTSVVPADMAVLVQYAAEVVASGVAYAYDFERHDDSTVVVRAHQHEFADHNRASVDDEYRVDRKTLLMLGRTTGGATWKTSRTGKHSKPTSLPALTDDQAVQVARLVKRAQAGVETTQRYMWHMSHQNLFISRIEPFTQEIEAAQRRGNVAAPSTMPLLVGLPGSIGRMTGPVRIMKKEGVVEPGDVVVLREAPHGDVSWLSTAAALICESGHLASREVQVAKQLGVPAVVASGTALSVLKAGQVVTVDGTNGVVYVGSVPDSVKPQTYLPITGTKVYASVIDPTRVDRTALTGFDGIGLLRSEFILRLIGVHPQDIITKKLHSEYVEVLAEGIEQAARAAYPHPVIYQLHDVETADLLGWRARGEDRHEPNPKLGYRGTHRLLAEPEVLELELQALSLVKAHGFSNISIMLPLVRSLDEVTEMQKRLGASPLAVHGDIDLWVKCETPALAIRADELAQLDIAGVCFNVPALTQLISGMDLENYQMAHHVDQADQAVMQALSFAIATCRAAGIETTIVSEMGELAPEIVQTAVENGVTGVCVSVSEVAPVHGLLASIEQRMVLDHLIAD